MLIINISLILSLYALDSVKNETDINIMDRAIIKDIETSSLDELNVWAETLGLPTGNNVNSVRQTLLNHYSLSPEVKNNKNGKKDITINRAELSKYYTIKDIDESIAEFEGRVHIIIYDPEKKVSHAIVADKINFNRTTNSVSAYGSVVYKKNDNTSSNEKNTLTDSLISFGEIPEYNLETGESSSSELVFAESLTFKIDNWKGSLVECISQQNKVIDEENIPFYYITGEIKKSDTDVMGMKNVSIQTVTGSPFFNISAIDFWMLEPSEFLMISPFVKVGHVPVLWVPFYYHTENSLYFNPAYGVRDREGVVFQNTIYVMGSKAKNEEESDFSFLSFKNGEESYNQELSGLSLVSSQDKTKYREDYSKIMADYYSKLGLYLGNNTYLTFDNIIDNVNLDAGIAFSRNINQSTGDVFDINGDSDWNSSYIAGTEVPFRYILSLKVDSKYFEADYFVMSDTYFKADFYNREENFMWINHFTSQLDDGVEGLNSSDGYNSYIRDLELKNSPEITHYSWGIDFKKIDPDFKAVKPFINNMILDFGNIEMDFDSKKVSDSTIDSSDPNIKFFYPEKSVIPVTFKISGDLYDTNYDYIKDNNKISFDYSYDNPLFDIDNPYKANKKEDDKEVIVKEDKDLFKIEPPGTYDDITSAKGNQRLLDTKLSYAINIPVTYIWQYDYTNWDSVEDVNYDLKTEDLLYWFDPSGNINYTLKLLNSFIVLNDYLNGNIYSKQYADSSTGLHSDDELIAANRWTKTTLKNSVKISINPLNLFKPIKYHSISFSYNLDKLLFSRTYNEENSTALKPLYEEKSFKWEEDYITDNSITAKYVFDLGVSTSSISYNKKLAPIEEKYIATGEQKFNFSFWDFVFTASGKVEYSESFLTEEDENGNEIESDEDMWKKDPLYFSLKYTPFNNIVFSSALKYDLEDEDFSLFNNSIKLWPLTISINSIYSKNKNWDDATYRWIEDSESKETLKLNNILTTLNIVNYENWFWKNRIKLNLYTKLLYDKKFIEINDSSFNLDLSLNLDIYKFLSVKFNTSSENRSMFLYNKEDRDVFNLDGDYNLIYDLVKSFNFFNHQDRVDSLFNLKKINFDIIYKMPDWNLEFSYSGAPKLNDDTKVYDWDQVFSFFIKWKPLSMVKSNVENREENWSVSTADKEE